MARVQQILQIDHSNGESFSALRDTANVKDVKQGRLVVAPNDKIKMALSNGTISISLEVNSPIEIQLNDNGIKIPIYGFMVLNTLPNKPYDYMVIYNGNGDAVDINYLLFGV